MVFYPIMQSMEIFASMLSVEVHKRTNVLDKPLTENTSVEAAHELLPENVHAVPSRELALGFLS